MSSWGISEIFAIVTWTWHPGRFGDAPPATIRIAGSRPRLLLGERPSMPGADLCPYSRR